VENVVKELTLYVVPMATAVAEPATQLLEHVVVEVLEPSVLRAATAVAEPALLDKQDY